MTTLQMFPPTEAERLATIRSYLAEQCEKRSEAVTRAMVKHLTTGCDLNRQTPHQKTSETQGAST